LQPLLEGAEPLGTGLQRPDRQRGPLAGQNLEHVPARAQGRVHVVLVVSAIVAPLSYDSTSSLQGYPKGSDCPCG
jgi:hypothetical protein